MEYPRPYIITREEKFVCLTEPHPDQISTWMIAHSLSNLCRWNGHTPNFYSVAEHSVACAREMERQNYDELYQLAALFHDASEAIFGDLSSPFKKILGESYYEHARKWDECICSWLDLEAYHFEAAHEVADVKLLAIEARFFFPEKSPLFLGEPSEEDLLYHKPQYWSNIHARRNFIQHHYELREKINSPISSNG